MKKILSMILTFAMIFSFATMGVAAASDTTTSEKGSITINGVSEDVTYEIYRLLDLESYDITSGAYSYKVNSDWIEFFETDGAKTYITVDEQEYATWIAAEDDDTVAAFAKIALAYAKSNGISPVKTTKTTEDHPSSDMVIQNNTGVFSELDLGYYLIDSSVGALCGLTTTNPNASINAKNGKPTIDKQVKEDSTEQWGDENTADIGQIVEYRVTINVHAGAENYVLHDHLSDGLTFLGVSKIEHIIPGKDTHETPKEGNYEVVTENLDDDCTFEVRFTQDFCDKLETNDKIIVYYTAMFNRNAVIAGEGNTNTAKLTFGEGNTSNIDTVNTKTFGIDIVKTDSQNTLIDGAEFKIYDNATGGNEIPVVLMDDGVTYRRARTDETGVSIVVKDGKVRVVGFDNGTYYLEETVTPLGYNQLSARHKFIISDNNLDAIFNDGIFSTGSGVHVVNKSGTMLPETGAGGKALFITIGAIAVLGTGVLLVTKKRMSMIEE